MLITLDTVLTDIYGKPIDFPKPNPDKTLCRKCQLPIQETTHWTLRDALVDALGSRYEDEIITATQSFERYLLAARILKSESTTVEISTGEAAGITKVFERYFLSPAQRFPAILLVDPAYKP